jgi:signal transduction histidine kinase/CheY-like chemotaxis protein/HPt (histidine-containing phosphotransfer) domain-containing protein
MKEENAQRVDALPLRLLLSFSDSAYERQFVQYYNNFYYRYAQVSLALALVLVSGDFIVDFLAFSNQSANNYRIEFCLPIIVFGLACSFTRYVRRHWQPVMAGFIAVLAFSLFWVMVVLDREGAMGLRSWVGILNFIFLEFYCFVILGVQFNYALVSGALILFAFELTMLLMYGPERGIFCYWSYHVVTSFILAAVIGWWREFVLRKDFVAKTALDEARQTAERLSQVKTNFLAAMSHEIRTPMNGVIGMNDLLLETGLTPAQRKLAETVRYSADALLTILDAILDVSKLEAGKIHLEETEFDLPTLVEKTVELLDPLAKQKSLSVNVDIADGGRAAFRGDQTRLRQILLNLGSNAIKFTEHGGVTIAIAGTADDNDCTRVRFEVRDTGIGIPDGAKALLFAPFVQADDSITRRFGGTGLGLSICKQLVELMGGRIGIADRFGGGTVFWFEAKLRNAAPVEADHGGLDHIHGSGPAAPISGHILLAEDNKVNIEVATLILEGAGYTVDVATDGFEAVAAARRRDYSLILMDMQMPGMDGVSATREIRAFERSEKRVPIIAMTANAMADDQRRCLEAGMDDYVSKPITPAKLRQTVARWMEEYALPATGNSIELVQIDALPVIEQDIVDSIRSCMDKSKFSSLVDFYIAQSKEQSDQFQQWQSSLTLGEIGDEAHKIISSAGALGARRVQELAGRLQTACRAGDEASMPVLLDQLTSASAAASSALRKMLAA